MRKHIIWSFEKNVLQNSLNNSKSYSELFEILGLEVSKSLIKMLQYRIKIDGIDKLLNKIATEKKSSELKNVIS